MSKGKWTEKANPHGHKERAELASRLEDVAARLHSAQADVGILSQLVRQIELGGKR